MSHNVLPKDHAQVIWRGQDLIASGVGTTAPGYFDPNKFYEIYYDGSNALTLQEWQMNGYSQWASVGNAFAADASATSWPVGYSSMIKYMSDDGGYTPQHINFTATGPVYELNSTDHNVNGSFLILDVDSSKEAYSADMDNDGSLGENGDVDIFPSETAMIDMFDFSGLTPLGNYSGGTYTATASQSGSQGGGGDGYVATMYSETPSEGNDKIQINMANSTGALSAMVDATQGLDSLHLDGFNIFSDSLENLTVDNTDATVTSDMIFNSGSGIFNIGSNYTEINLGNELSGQVHVWTQTPEFYNGNEPFDTVLGVIEVATGRLIEANDNGNPSSSYNSQINNLISENNSSRSMYDSFLSFNAINGTEYSIVVGDRNQTNNYSEFGGVFDLYAISDVYSTDTLLLSETNLINTSGAFVDFSSGEQGKLQSAWVTSFGNSGDAVSFTIDNFEELRLTDYADYVVVTKDVGDGVGTVMHSASYFSASQSGMIIDPGKSINGVDKLSVHSDSSLYLSFLDSSEMSGDGVDVNIGNGLTTASGVGIDTVVEKYDGTGLLIDYLETTSYADDVTNSSDDGMVVNLGGNWDSSGTDYFTGSTTAAAIDVLDARMANELEFDTYESGGSWVQVSGYNEIHSEIGDDVYYLDSGSYTIPSSGYYTIREDMGNYWVTQVGGDGAGIPFNVNMGASEYLTTMDSTDFGGLTSAGNIEAPATVVDARLQNVDYIMVRDETLAVTGQDYEQIWQSLHDADVDFYVDMSDIYRADAQLIANLGAGTVDNYGEGYDVQTSARVAKFGVDNYNLNVYYDGKHTDFTDEDDIIDVSTPGAWKMATGSTSIGANWATEVSENTSGGGGSFYILVEGKKIAVKHSDNEWVVDNTSLSIAQGVNMGSGSETIRINYDGKSEVEFIDYVANRYGLSENLSDSSDYSFSNSIYLNATEEQIQEVLDGNGSISSAKAFNFGFYTKATIGGTTVNLKITQDVSDPIFFSLDIYNIDLMVESLYNRVENVGESIDSGNSAGNFVKVDNENDIAMGNGGNDTYVISENGGGTALEYGDINIAEGGLLNSRADSINFANIDSIADLELERGKVKNEKTDNTLLVNESGDLDKTAVFDNFNEYLDFRRVEFLTIDDASNNDEIFEISVDGNIGNDDGNDDNNIKDLEWDNEIVVAKNTGETIYADGGTDILVGGNGVDVFNLENVVGGNMPDHDTMSHVHIKNISENDSIVMDTDDTLAADDLLSDGIVTVQKDGGTVYMLFTDDEDMLRTHLEAALVV